MDAGAVADPGRSCLTLLVPRPTHQLLEGIVVLVGPGEEKPPTESLPYCS